MQTYYQGTKNNEFLKTLSQDLPQIFEIDKEILNIQPNITFVVPQNLIDNSIIKITIENQSFDVNLGTFGIRDDIFAYIIDICNMIQIKLMQENNLSPIVTYNALSIKNFQTVQLIFKQSTSIQILQSNSPNNYWLQKLLGTNDTEMISVKDVYEQSDGTTNYRINFPIKFYSNFIRRVNVLCPLLNETTIFENQQNQYNILRSNLDQFPGTRVTITAPNQSTITTQQLINGISISFTDENYHLIELDQQYYIELNVQKTKQRQQMEIERQQQLQFNAQVEQQQQQLLYQEQQLKQKIMVDQIQDKIHQVEQNHIEHNRKMNTLPIEDSDVIALKNKKKQIDELKTLEQNLVQFIDKPITEDQNIQDYFTQKNQAAQQLDEVIKQMSQYVTEYHDASQFLKQNPQEDQILANAQNALTGAIDGLKSDYNNGMIGYKNVEDTLEYELQEYNNKVGEGFQLSMNEFLNNIFNEHDQQEIAEEQDKEFDQTNTQQNEQEEKPVIKKQKNVINDGLSVYKINGTVESYKLDIPQAKYDYYIVNSKEPKVYNKSTNRNIEIKFNKNNQPYIEVQLNQGKRRTVPLNEVIDMQAVQNRWTKMYGEE
ncbi:Hypothetical_protein [Hexamita inflata]|uniref:Hypothetical_protein n=1 Tax=Hexamita inflata TaxID=28002 RepID=A0AA86NM66_9EUKA|nr:Hypothetical protein HINF_LOCUS10195 [Hexamita inflata]